jgi:hypothetical protein
MIWRYWIIFRRGTRFGQGFLDRHRIGRSMRFDLVTLRHIPSWFHIAAPVVIEIA